MIYVHVPFCRSFCIYCGFYSEICPKGRVSEIVSWKNGVIAETECRRDFLCRARSGREGPDTLYFGGGTPSLLSPDILSEIVSSFGDAPFGEFTLEANPDDIVRGGLQYVESLVSLGVNRVSMGVQSFDDDILAWMGRRHSAADALHAVDLLRRGGIANISIDLIFGLSQLSMERWEQTVGKALSIRPEHISAYALSIEEGSVLEGKVASGEYVPAPDEVCRQQYDLLCSMLGAAGYEHYEISNFALPGRRAVHNSAYWNGSSYIGLGPGAHSYDSVAGLRSWNEQSVSSCHGMPCRMEGSEKLSPEEKREEEVMLSLRTSAGIDEKRLASLCGEEVLRRGLSAGVLEKTGDGRVRIPERHFFISDDIIADLF